MFDPSSCPNLIPTQTLSIFILQLSFALVITVPASTSHSYVCVQFSRLGEAKCDADTVCSSGSASLLHGLVSDWNGGYEHLHK